MKSPPLATKKPFLQNITVNISNLRLQVQLEMYMPLEAEVEGSNPSGRGFLFLGWGVVWGLGFRLRTKGTFTTRNSHFGAVRVRGCP